MIYTVTCNSQSMSKIVINVQAEDILDVATIMDRHIDIKRVIKIELLCNDPFTADTEIIFDD